MSSNTAAKTPANTTTKTRMMVQIAMLTAVAEVLMLFDFPLPFAPSFYKIDLSEVPILIGCFAMGPAAGIIIEAMKILLNFIISGTVTAGVGELANFAIGCSMVLPAGLIYRYHKTRKNAVLGMAAGTLVMAAIGGLLNCLFFPSSNSRKSLASSCSAVSAGFRSILAVRYFFFNSFPTFALADNTSGPVIPKCVNIISPKSS